MGEAALQSKPSCETTVVPAVLLTQQSVVTSEIGRNTINVGEVAAGK